jgi:hypothetical protein
MFRFSFRITHRPRTCGRNISFLFIIANIPMPRQVHSGALSPKNLSRILTSCIIFLKNAFLLFKSVHLHRVALSFKAAHLRPVAHGIQKASPFWGGFF